MPRICNGTDREEEETNDLFGTLVVGFLKLPTAKVWNWKHK